MRDDYFDWPAHLETVLAQIDADVVVVSIGTNDRQAITLDGVIHQRFTDSWRTIYGERASGVMERLTQEGVETFWMGLPSARNRVFANDMAFINGILEESAAAFSARAVRADLAGNDRRCRELPALGHRRIRRYVAPCGPTTVSTSPALACAL